MISRWLTEVWAGCRKNTGGPLSAGLLTVLEHHPPPPPRSVGKTEGVVIRIHTMREKGRERG